MNTPQRILIFNVNWLGDVIFSTPVIRNIRKNYPGSHIACVIPPRCREVLEGNPYLDEVILFDERTSHRGFFSKLAFIGLLRKKRFDTVFLLHRSLSRALICYLAGIPRRIGHYTRRRSRLLTTVIKPPGINTVHRAEYYLSVIKGAGLTMYDRGLDFSVTDEHRSFVIAFLQEHGISESGFLVVLNPGGNWLLKRWPAENWAVLADSLIRECAASVVINGSAQDTELAGKIGAMMRETPVIACGPFSLKHVGALAQISDCFISADTGPLHIAVAAGARNVVGIFGPTSSDLTGPYPDTNAVVLHKSVGCTVPCYETECPDNRCMRAVTPEEVLARVKEMTKK